ncbi:hypothetical protein GQ55_1G310000 [Panicum hallii var. hallii]|uniref:Uncharacterized protein n=1 Tax=Panicum hallii var. hallii TaxID=1504633 RepID=A0A2T7F9B9_9POAL|nr:hypothetical protein GQ55_1G310000 [Panicum hallii var. hallii]
MLVVSCVASTRAICCGAPRAAKACAAPAPNRMQTWPRLIMKAKDGHEQAMACAAPNPDLRRLERPRASARQYYFVDPYDLIRFVKLVKRMASTSTPTSAATSTRNGTWVQGTAIQNLSNRRIEWIAPQSAPLDHPLPAVAL